MDEILCSVCKRIVDRRELGEHAPEGGEVICSQCLSRMRENAPIQCSRCGAKMPPVSDGKSLLCRKCGATLGQAEPSFVATPVRSAPGLHQRTCPYCGTPVRPDALRCAFCGSSLAPGEREVDALLRRNHRLSLALGVLGAFCVILVLGGALVVVALSISPGFFVATAPGTPSPVQAPEPTPVLDEQLAPDAEQIQNWIAQAVERSSREMQQAKVALEAELAELKSELEKLRAATQSSPPAPPDRPVGPVERSPDDVAEAIRRIVAGTPVPSPAPNATPADALDAAAKAYFEMLKRNVEANMRNEHFAAAMRALETFPEKYGTTRWQQEVERAKADLSARAETVQQEKLSEAEALMRKGDIYGARRLYQWLAERALPDAAQVAHRYLEAIEIALSSQHEQERAAADRRALIQSLLLDLRNLQNPLRSEAAARLGELKAQEAVPDLVAALKDSDWFLVVRAARALGEIGDRRAIAALIDAMSNRFPAVPAAVAEALQKLTGQNFGEDQARWRTWWQENRHNYPEVIE